MNNKELIAKLSSRLGKTQIETSQKVEALVAVFRAELTQGKAINLNAFGSFELKKKEARVAISPIDKTRIMVPSKMSLVFKQSGALKEKISKA